METTTGIYRDYEGNEIKLEDMPEWKREGVLAQERENEKKAARIRRQQARHTQRATGDWGFIAAISGIGRK